MSELAGDDAGSWLSPQDTVLSRMCSCFATYSAQPDMSGRSSSEAAAECVRQAHWEGSRAAREDEWWINDETCYSEVFEFIHPEEDTRLTGFKADWRPVIGGVTDELMVKSFMWNVRVAVPPDGFDVVAGLIQVPYRVSPTATAPAGAVLKFRDRTFRVRETTEIVLPTEIVRASVDPVDNSIVRCVHEGTCLRGDGRKINSGGVGLPKGMLLACGFDPDAAEVTDTFADAAARVFRGLPSPFKSPSSGDGADRWT